MSGGRWSVVRNFGGSWWALKKGQKFSHFYNWIVTFNEPVQGAEDDRKMDRWQVTQNMSCRWGGCSLGKSCWDNWKTNGCENRPYLYICLELTLFVQQIFVTDSSSVSILYRPLVASISVFLKFLMRLPLNFWTWIRYASVLNIYQCICDSWFIFTFQLNFVVYL